MVNYKDIIDKLKRRVSKEEYEKGVLNYVNSPDFQEMYAEQIKKANENYIKAGAPETWAVKQKLKLQLVSAEEWKDAITAEGVADKYYNDLLAALDKKGKYFSIPAEQDNLILDILEKLNITDKRKRMLTAYWVGQYFEKLVMYKLAGDDKNYSNTKNSLIKGLENDGILNAKDTNAVNEISEAIDTRVTNAVNILTS